MKYIVLSMMGIMLASAPSFAEGADNCTSVPTEKPKWIESSKLPTADAMPRERFDYNYFKGKWREVSYGVGHITLRLTSENSTMVWDWNGRIEMPLYAGPEGEPWGWLVKESVADLKTKEITPVGTAGMLEVGYEQLSFIVLEDSDGWMRIRFGAPSAPRGGTAWIPKCLLDELEPSLEVVTWEELFLSDYISPMFFRSEAPHSLRESPSAQSKRVGVISGDHHLEPLEIEGDWMRVKVVTPSNYCASDDMKVTVREGWIKWRSPEKGPWVWFYTRGC